jgi:nitrogen fixation protein
MQQRTRNLGNYNQRTTGNRLGLVPGQPLRNIARCAAGVGIRLANGVMKVIQVCAEVLQKGFVLLANGVRMAVSALMRAGHLIFEAGRWVLNGVATFLHGATVVLANGVRVALGVVRGAARIAVNGTSRILTGRPLIRNNGGYNNNNYAQNDSSRYYCHKCGKYHTRQSSNNQSYQQPQYQEQYQQQGLPNYDQSYNSGFSN